MPQLKASLGALRQLRRPVAALTWAVTTTAFAQKVDATTMGQGFFDYAKPYVVWSGAAMVLLCVAAAAFLKQFLKEALMTAGIVVMLVFLFNTFPDLVRALSR